MLFRSLTRTRKWKHKRGRVHHIATDHVPMVQGGLLTAHTGGVHGYGWSPEGGISFRQGAGAASPGSPDLETAAAGNREEFAKIRSVLGVSTPRGKYRRRGASRGPTRKPGGLLARPRVGPRQGPSWSLVMAPPLPPLVIPEVSWTLIFNIIFPEFFGHF